MSEVTISGHVYVIEPTKAIGQKGFKKRTIVVESDNGKYANYIPVELTGQDACDSADSLSLGDEVEFKCRVGGRKWQRDPSSDVKYFLSLESWGFTSNSAPKVVKEEQESAPAWDDESIPF